MLLGAIFQSIVAWRKLASLCLPAKTAYKILKYTKLVTAEGDIAETQRVALIHEITGTKEGEPAEIKPDTPEFAEYVKRFNEALLQEVDLPKIDLTMDDMVNAIPESSEELTASDFATLEPFFAVSE